MGSQLEMIFTSWYNIEVSIEKSCRALGTLLGCGNNRTKAAMLEFLNKHAPFLQKRAYERQRSVICCPIIADGGHADKLGQELIMKCRRDFVRCLLFFLITKRITKERTHDCAISFK